MAESVRETQAPESERRHEKMSTREREPGSGRSLPPTLRAEMEGRFKHRFSDVRIFDDAGAGRYVSDLGAVAAVQNTDLYFAPGKYAPYSESGRARIAHELTHVVQQRGQSVRRDAPPAAVTRDSPQEIEARVNARIANLPSPLPVQQNLPVGSIALDDGQDVLAELGVDTRSFSQLWAAFDTSRLRGNEDEALGLVRSLLVRMTFEDAVAHAGDLAAWLIAHDQRELALQALAELESAWWIRYVQRVGPGVPQNIYGGFGTPLGPEDLTELGESEAESGHHDTALKLLSVAHLMVEMMLERIHEQIALDESAAEAMGDGGELALAMGRILMQGDLDELTALRLRILNVYPRLASRARAEGDRAGAEALATHGGTLLSEISERSTLGSEATLGPVEEPAQAPTPAPRRARVGRARRARAPETASVEEPGAAVAEPDAEPERELPLAEADQIIEGPPPFEGGTALALPGNHYVNVESQRYAVSEVLSRAVAWGRNLFGVMSSIVVAHYDEDGVVRFYAAALDEDLTESFPRIGPMDLIRVRVQTPLESLPNDYHIMIVHVGDGVGFWPSVERRHLYNYFLARQRAQGGAEVSELGRELVRTHVFAQIDRLMEDEENNRQEISRLLSELDATAFATLTTQRRYDYLSVLLRAWTWHAQERAIVEIIKSIESRTEFDAVIERLRDAGIWDQLVNDLDHELWGLLTTVGQRFSTEEFGVQELYEVMDQAGLLNMSTPIPGLSIGPDGPEFEIDVLAQIEEAALSFVRFVEGIWDSIVMLVTEPDKIIEGLAQLTKMIFVFELARIGYPPAIEMRNQILASMARTILDGIRGVHLLGVGDRILRRIKWALIWEIASWFVGIGEIRAAMTAMGASARVGAIARFLRLLGIIGEAARVEEATTGLARLARILSGTGRVLRTEEEVLVALSHLPDDEVTRLGRALEGVDLDDTMNLARLRTAHPDLAAVAEPSFVRAEVLHELASAAGGFTDDVVRAFARLSDGGHSAEQLAHIVSLIPEGEAHRFVRVMRMVPEDVSLSGARSLSTLEAIATSPARMGDVERYGFRAVDAILEHTGRDTARADELLDALRLIDDELPEADHARQMRDLVEGIENGDPAALQRVEQRAAERAGTVETEAIPATRFPREVQDAIEESFPPHNARAWRRSMADSMPPGEYVYVVRDLDTGGILKVGKTSHAPGSQALDRRMSLYRNAAEMTGRNVQVELHRINPGGRTTETFEGLIRRQLYQDSPGEGAARGFEWDSVVPHNRGRVGPGTPGEVPTGRQTVEVLEVQGERLRVRTQDGVEQWITPSEDTLQAVRSRSVPWDQVDVRRRHLYEWRSFEDGSWRLVYRGSPEGVAPQIPLARRLRTMDTEELRETLTALARRHQAPTARAIKEGMAAELGLEVRTVEAWLQRAGLRASSFRTGGG